MFELLLHYKMKTVLLPRPLPTMSKVNYALSASPSKQISPTSFDFFSIVFITNILGSGQYLC